MGFQPTLTFKKTLLFKLKTTQENSPKNIINKCLVIQTNALSLQSVYYSRVIALSQLCKHAVFVPISLMQMLEM